MAECRAMPAHNPRQARHRPNSGSVSVSSNCPVTVERCVIAYMWRQSTHLLSTRRSHRDRRTPLLQGCTFLSEPHPVPCSNLAIRVFSYPPQSQIAMAATVLDDGAINAASNISCTSSGEISSAVYRLMLCLLTSKS